MAATLPYELLELVFAHLTRDEKQSDPYYVYAKQSPGPPSHISKELDVLDTSKTSTSSRSDLACAARVNKHWSAIATKLLYKSVHLRNHGELWLLSETLHFIQPKLRSRISKYLGQTVFSMDSEKKARQRVFSDLPQLAVLDATGLTLRLADVGLPALHTLRFSEQSFVAEECTESPSLSSTSPGRLVTTAPGHLPYCRCHICAKFRTIPTIPAKIHDVLETLSSVRVVSIHRARLSNTAVASRAVVPTDAEGQSSFGISTLELQDCEFSRPQIPEFWAPFTKHLRHLRLTRCNFNAGVRDPDLCEPGILSMLKTLGASLESFEYTLPRPVGSLAYQLLTNCRMLRIHTDGGHLSADVVYALPQTLERVHIRVPDSLDFFHQFLEALQQPTYLPKLMEVPYCDAMRTNRSQLAGSVVSAGQALESRGLTRTAARLAGSLLHQPGRGAAIHPAIPSMPDDSDLGTDYDGEEDGYSDYDPYGFHAHGGMYP